MTKIKLTKVIDNARKSLEDEETIPALKKSMSDLLEVVTFLTNRLGLDRKSVV